MKHKRSVAVAVAVLWAVMAWAVGTKGKADMPTLDWLGREEAVKQDRAVPLRVLREVEELGFAAEGVSPESASGVLVQGDNLETLRALLPFYAGEVKCIYIDPPYNTGSAFEHYDDNLEHATWLNLMFPRLKLLREFLREDGSIWISIDDREGAYLRVICDEIFGRQNFVSNISWQRTYSTRNDAKGIVNEVEHILVYSKREGWQPKKLPRTEEMNRKYKNPDNDVAPWTSSDAFAPSAATHQGMVYAIQNPFNGEWIYPYDGACWRYEQNEMLSIMRGWAQYELRELDDAAKRAEICGVSVEAVRPGVKAIVLAEPLEAAKASAAAVLKRGQWPRFYFTKNGKGGIRRKTYLSAVGDVPPTNLFEYQEVGHTDEAKKEVLKVFDGKSPFATPKPERLVQRILTIATDEGDLVLDSFLGSGTTAAVAHKMGRRWIGVELGDHAKTHCAVRLRKVVEGEQGGISKAVKWQGGGGFRFYELGEALLDAQGQLSESIPYPVLAAHIWWQEAGRAWNRTGAKGTFLGVHNEIAYALLYNGILHDRSVNGGNVLTRQTLAVIQEDIGEQPYRKLVIFGEACRLGPARLAEAKIDFRQTPYDVLKGR